MPEGPEIAVTVYFLRTYLLGKKLGKIRVLGGRYTHQVLKGQNLLQDTLKVHDVDFKGKFMWIELEGGIYILNTFGMSGRWEIASTADPNARVRFNLGDKYLYFIDPRNFGTVVMTKGRKALETKLQKLGTDLLQTDMTINELAHHITEYSDMRKTDQNIVKVLMDQEKGIGSGIGNYLCSEILYDAKISPHRTIQSLEKKEVRRLARSIKKIMKLAYQDNRTGYMQNFGSYIDKHISKVRKAKFPEFHKDIKLGKKKFSFKVYGQETDLKGNEVVREKINGDRTTHWVPEIQK